MYWIAADAAPIKNEEKWTAFVQRSADDVLAKFQQIVANTDFKAEAMQWPLLKEKMDKGFLVFDFLFFVLYFEAQVERC
jgi:hypothetical protein